MFRLAALASHPSPAADASPVATDSKLQDRVVGALRTVFDPEIPVNIYDLGLIYGLEVSDSGAVDVRMTLTAPACPVAGTMPGVVESAVRRVDGVADVHVELVWDPPWSRDRMSDDAKLLLGMP
ncbi:MAG: SUF system Fe-S cluster assembly protein [Gammaproteobacteria bacterium]|jgi:FeS assembly SUF system protein|nr:SUF system Fe-S cluster assembly protein [Gammaproteobacteria bacterium]